MHRKPDHPHRVVIENVKPRVDGGRFPVKRTPGEAVEVTADIFADGHDLVRAVLRWREIDLLGERPGAWREREMVAEANDCWTGAFAVERVGWYEYGIEAWIDHFGTWRRDLRRKFDAGQDVSSELLEGAQMARRAAARVAVAEDAQRRAAGQSPATRTDLALREHAWLVEQAARIEGRGDLVVRVEVALQPALEAAMAQHAERIAISASKPLFRVMVEPERARFGAWYEMFPRSAGPDPTRSATFDEAAERLHAIAAMGFDVVYLPPVHPIGRTFRKGRNNTLVAGPNDVGSPWAIGGPEGGHMAVEPGLGTIADFDRFVATAQSLGLEVALDIAFQCSPDHPYVKEHPEWFRHRIDGTIKYAENPPKKYQDIYPFDFECAHWPALWDELKRVLLFWVGHGVRIFRVDNPHTKPYRFWEWVLAEVRREHPGVIFLSEAFTRPKIMRHLAKLGFSQSYSYFTWRNTKEELAHYFTELAQSDVREYMRPNLFANTPDILHEYLQRGGPPAFMVRLVLAATLGATYGIYSSFELCEGRGVPGTEEYLDSEKYQIRHWDWDRPGNIVALVTRVNAIRRHNKALHGDWSLRFHQTDNPQVICYSKQTDDLSNVVLVTVNLDPFQTAHAWVKVPIADWKLDPAGYMVEDELTGERYFWRGEWNYVRLDPGYRPAHIIRVGIPHRYAPGAAAPSPEAQWLDELST